MNNLFKGIDNMTLLSYVTLVLSIAIFLSILFGCTYKRRFERFETEKTESDAKTEKKEIVLTEEEKKLLDGLQNGSIDEKKLETFITEEKFTKKTVEKLIEHIQEKFVDKVNSKDKK
jgi:hypothetical protein